MLKRLRFLLVAVALPLTGMEYTPDQVVPLSPQHQVSIQSPLLGGLSGARNYLVLFNGHTSVLRMLDPQNPRSRRHSEIQAAECAMHLGIGPEIYGKDEADTWMLMAFVEGGTLGEVTSRDLPELIAMIRKLHECQNGYPQEQTIIEKIRRQLNRALASNIPLPPEATQAALSALSEVEDHFSSHPLVPCHHDLSSLNILRDREGFKLIDWTDSGMSYAMADLAYFALVNRISESMDCEVLRLYHGRDPTWSELEDLQLMRAVNAIRIFAANFPAYEAPLNQVTERVAKARQYEARLQHLELPDLDHFFARHARGELVSKEAILDLSLSALQHGISRLTQPSPFP